MLSFSPEIIHQLIEVEKNNPDYRERGQGYCTTPKNDGFEVKHVTCPPGRS